MDVQPWQERLALIVRTMREMSTHTDPQVMVREYAARMRELNPTDRMVALSRRGLPAPQYRITRSSVWKQEINPWREAHRLPVLAGGLLGELIYAGEPRVINEFCVQPDDPAAEYFTGMRSIMALPNFDRGEALNMVVMMKAEPHYFDYERLPEMVWMSNLFGRATQNLVLSDELRRAYEIVDNEMKVVADIQRSLLPADLPDIPSVQLAAHYQTSQQAGGDYYDFFALPDGRVGFLIADVSGHGTPAAVIMAITHAISHTYPTEPVPPGAIMTYVNDKLTTRYTTHLGAFVTAFYGIYDPKTRELRYTSAGHNPPRIRRCDTRQIEALDRSSNLPLGIVPDEIYEESVFQFRPGDQVIFYTDGITEAHNPAGDLFGVQRLDEALSRCQPDAQAIIDHVLAEVDRFAAGRAADDDRTLVVAKIL